MSNLRIKNNLWYLGFQIILETNQNNSTKNFIDNA